MPINTPETIQFVLSKLRPFANNSIELYYFAKRIIAEWNASEMDKKITNTTDKISDKSADSGGHEIIGSDANAIIKLCNDIISLIEKDLNLNILTKAGIKE